MTDVDDPLACRVLGHAWRRAAGFTSHDLTWWRWLCTRCPARIDYAPEWGKPESGAMFTRGDVISLAIAGPIVVAILYAAGQA